MRWPFLLLIGMTVLSLAAGPVHAWEASPPPDAGARAAIIYNFVRFSSWGADRFAASSSPVVLCVPPRHALAGHLAAFDGRAVGERTLQVRRTETFDRRCHAAVVADASPSALVALTRDGVLTIGDSRGFTAHGAIGMITVGRQIRFEINNRVAREAGVALSSRLLRLAVAVR